MDSCCSLELLRILVAYMAEAQLTEPYQEPKDEASRGTPPQQSGQRNDENAKADGNAAKEVFRHLFWGVGGD